MRNILILIFIPTLHLLAENSYSQNTRLSFDMQNVSIEKLLYEIEDQSEMYFVYNSKLVDTKRTVNIIVENQTISEILSSIFTNSDIDYLVMDRQVLLSPKDLLSKVKANLQPKTITGTVLDENGEPLPGVSILIKSTTRGVVTNLEGEYTIEVDDPEAVLVFSYVGYLTKELPVNDQTVLDVELAVDVFGLEEIVVIGYGTVKRKDLSGSVASVQGDVLAERQSTQLSQALQGALSGVMVTRSSGDPTASATIRIRGITTIGENDPLIIIDGIPAGHLDDVNPNDIQDIAVLKDAASASIYGSRAAAGVILITTKRAKSGELNMTYNANYGFETPTEWSENVDVIRFMQMDNELRWNDNGNVGTEYSTYPQEVIENYWSLNAENPDLYPNTDWQDLILKSPAPRTSHNLAISVGQKAVYSKISINYDKVDGLYKGKSYQRFTTRFNNDITINKYLSATVDGSWKHSISNDAIGDPWNTLRTMPAVFPAVWRDGRIASGKAGSNAYGTIEKGGFKKGLGHTLSGKISIDFMPVEGLKLSAVLSPTFVFGKYKEFNKLFYYTVWDDPTVIEGNLNNTTSTILSEVRNDSHWLTKQFLASYIKSFGGHNLNILAGYEDYYFFKEDMGASREQYILSTFPYLDLGPLDYDKNYGRAYENAYTSVFGRIMYNFKNKYYLQGNIRYDGSSRFAKEYRWGAFPSFSAAWAISEEPFLNNIETLSFLKFRGSWGTLGNERIGRYPYQSSIAFYNTIFFQGSNVVSAQSAAQQNYAIRDISWETTESFNIGIDAGLFNNRLRVTAEYYQKTTKDMLLALEIPDYMGFENPDQNTGKMDTKGWDADISWNGQLGELGYSLSANISDFTSVMGDLGGTEFVGDKIKKEGSEFDEWYGYLSDGLFQTQEEVDNSPKLFSTVQPGDIKYKDISGPDGAPDGIISPEYDRVLLGGSLPRYMYGANAQLYYKGFDFSVVIQGVAKQNSRLLQNMVEPFIANYANVPKYYEASYWSLYNTEEENLTAKNPRLTFALKDNNYTMSDYWLIKGPYLRLKNITLGYTIPAKLTKKVKIRGLRLYGSVSDLLSFHKFPKGWDPEVGNKSYPITTSVIFGISFNF